MNDKLVELLKKYLSSESHLPEDIFAAIKTILDWFDWIEKESSEEWEPFYNDEIPI